ncbi:glycosyltransferase family 2 protein [Methanobacterium sp. BAmetb5]|uniref:glycosyltransferase family 2 protein n=1 Tax=Methanobacterium sp. BAmetb5 TaxID=2025351 RepID=UPI000E84BF26|nr:glycosyltransferase family 2 protein [Methanobacterium sp. BAmetb5]AXV39032.1 MAG: hypothetical protein CIT02_01250 [Methanobacterium sp. BAmetb5]
MKNKDHDLETTHRVSIVIINWNNWMDTLECLKSLLKINSSSFQIVLVDNNSTDDSITHIRDFARQIPLEIAEFRESELENLRSNNDLQEKLVLIKNNINHGFAAGNNIGVRFALQYLNPDYVLLLNNDTIAHENFLHELLRVAGRNDRVGSIQPVLLNYEASAIDSLGQECYWWGAEDICMGQSLKSIEKGMFGDEEIFGSCAAAALYPSEVLRETGLFDGDFFVELEDVDLSWRIRLSGYNSFLAGNALVYHKRGISSTLSSGDIIKGVKDESMVRKWHRQSRNWLVIVTRYYPKSIIARAIFRYPHKVLFTLFRLIYSSIILGKIRKTGKILHKNLKVRKKVKKNRFWSQIWQKWIKNSPTKCGNVNMDS